MSGRSKAGVAGSCGRVGQAVLVGVSRTIESECKLFGCRHAEQSGRAVQGIGCWGGQGDAGGDVCEERGHERGGGRVFEERFVGGTLVGGFGVLDDGEEGGVERVEEIDDEGGVSLTINNVVLARHHHVEVG